MDPYKSTNRSFTGVVTALLISAIALVVASLSYFASHASGTSTSPGTAHRVPSILERINKDKVIHAAYGVTPPYTQEDPNNTNLVSGYTVDIVERIAKDLKVKVVWHRLNWTTFIPDIKRGEFDMIGEPIFMTIPRCTELSFSTPIAYFADGVVVVKKGDQRFQKFADLNKSGVRVAVQMGFASETIARTALPAADIVAVAPGTDQLQLFNEVVAGRADATVSEGGHATRYAKEHPSLVEILNLEHPAAWVRGAFAFRSDDADGARAFSVCLTYLRLTGELTHLRQKWGLPALESPDAAQKLE